VDNPASAIEWDGPVPRTLDQAVSIAVELRQRGLVPLRDDLSAGRPDPPDQPPQFSVGTVTSLLNLIGCSASILRAPTRWAGAMQSVAVVSWVPLWVAIFASIAFANAHQQRWHVDSYRMAFLAMAAAPDMQFALRAAYDLNGADAFVASLVAAYDDPEPA
jgi:hypothetical protein